MATVSDEFIIRLGLDPTSFRKGRETAEQEFKKAKESAVAASKSMEESNKNLAETFNVAKRELVGFYAALLGATGLKDFLQNVNDTNAALGRFAQNIGATTGDVSGWDAAVGRMGGTSEEANASLNTISKALFDLHNNGKALAPEIYRLQGGLGKIAGTTFDTEHGVIPFMNDMAAQAQKLAAIDPQAAFRLLEGAGISEATANTMIKYGSGMGAYVKALQEGLAPSKEAIKAAQDLQASWAAAQQTVTSLGNEVAGPLDNALISVLDPMTKWVAANKDLIALDVKTWVKDLSDGIASFAPWPNLVQVVAFFKELKADADDVVSVLNSIKDWENGKGHTIIDVPALLRNPPGAPKDAGPGAGHSTPIPWGKAWDWLKDNWGINPAHAGDLDAFQAGKLGAMPTMKDFEQGRSSAQPTTRDFQQGSELQIQGSSISHGNPMPVDIVKASGSGGADSLLGGPMGSGAPLEGFGSGKGGHGGENWPGSRRGTTPGDIHLPAQGGTGKGQAGFGLYATDVGLASNKAMSPESRAFLDTIGTGETPHGSYSNPDFDPGGLGGRYQFLKSSWVTEARKAGVDPADFSPNNQDKVAYHYAGEVVRQKTGQNIDDLLKAGPGGVQKVIAALSPGVWNGIGNVDRDKAGHSGAVALYLKKLKDEQGASAKPPVVALPAHPHTPTPGAHLSSLGAQHQATTSKSSNAFHIAHLSVDARGHKNADGIANDISASLERSTMTMMSQSGQV